MPLLKTSGYNPAVLRPVTRASGASNPDAPCFGPAGTAPRRSTDGVEVRRGRYRALAHL